MSTIRSRPYLWILAVVALVAGLGGAVLLNRDDDAQPARPAVEPVVADAGAGTRPAPPKARKPPADLPVVAYAKGPDGLPDDPAPVSVVVITEAMRPTAKTALYDAPGGEPLAFLPPRISGLPTVVPIVAREEGWAAVLVPATNRKVGWVPTAGWRPEPLRDQLVVNLAERRLIWLRGGEEQGRWTVAIGTKRTPTPTGRTYVMGRTGTSGSAFAGLDALVLGSVPEEPEKLSAALRGAHTGIHAWSNSAVFGRSVSNGCVRMPAKAQRKLLDQVDPGTPVIVTA
ncbi:L,D-transpeptidase [Actinoplanes sp. G11-F43]|uniref:L,D-transpeptidase n=1 Tax=Actinoplanes sp. G11-F43 TaxID=3424130 RepID=UPI003D3286C0